VNDDGVKGGVKSFTPPEQKGTTSLSGALRRPLGQPNCSRHLHHEVAPRIPHHPFQVSLVVTPSGPSELSRNRLCDAIRGRPRWVCVLHRDSRVAVENRVRDTFPVGKLAKGRSGLSCPMRQRYKHLFQAR
jgi:hypothetical protein